MFARVARTLGAAAEAMEAFGRELELVACESSPAEDDSPAPLLMLDLEITDADRELAHLNGIQL